MTFIFKNLAINLAFFCLRVAAQGKCDHYLDKKCIDAYGSAIFDFQPLFSEPPRFGYGFRVFHESEISDSLSGRPPAYRGDVNDVKSWLEWSNGTFLVDRKANRTSDFALLLSNATGEISGGNNGCDGLLGATCVANLKDILKWAIVLAGRETIHVFRENVQLFQQTPLTNLSCPTNIFENFMDYQYLRNFDTTPRSFNDEPATTGNATSPWTTDLQYRSAEAQLGLAAIGIIGRFPSGENRSVEDIQLELVCVRPQPVEGSQDRINLTAATTATGAKPTGSSPPKSAASFLEATGPLLWFAVAVVTAYAL